MPLFIDCYNLLHADMPPSLAGLEEDGLCRLLAASPWAGDRIVVVCDGVVKPGTPRVSPVSQVELIYSGKDRTADDVIIQMVVAYSAPRSMYVVTDDREIRAAVRRRKAQVISTGSFIRALATTPPSSSRPSPVARHRPTLPAGEVNAWLEEFGIDPNAPSPEAAIRHDERATAPRRVPIENEPPQPPANPQDVIDDEEVANWLKEFGIAPDQPIDPRQREWWE